MGYKVLAVGSQGEFASLVKSALAGSDLSVDFTAKGSEGLQASWSARPDLIMLNWDLADIPGLMWVKMLRQTREGEHVPIIVVSGNGREEAEVAQAFDSGADDFVQKNIDPRELSARIRVVLRRRYGVKEDKPSGVLAVGPVSIDSDRHECRVNEKKISLRPLEFELLSALMRKAGRVLGRDYLLETVWGMSRNAETRAVDAGISRLRRALGARAGKWVESVSGYGYRFRSPE